jgi:methylthioribose-1-phosphate isomerase
MERRTLPVTHIPGNLTGMTDNAQDLKNVSGPEDIKPPAPVAQWVGDSETGFLRLLDQTLLPEETIYVDCSDSTAVWESIRRLAVRGAPALGYLVSSRPTAVNLEWAVNRQMARAVASTDASPTEIRRILLDEAAAIHAEDEAMCLSIGRAAAPLICQAKGVLTHCNAGALATGGIGTATAGMYVAHASGHVFTVYCDETRPLLQGSRLTAWELNSAGIDAVVITDNMAAQVMREGRIDMVITGADRIAANGDAANKIGTYGVAIMAKHHGIPFYVAAPYSTFDLDLPGGEAIPIEQRGAEEITEGFGRRTAPRDIGTYSPAFDVTPADLITAIITDRGVIDPVNTDNVRKIIVD